MHIWPRSEMKGKKLKCKYNFNPANKLELNRMASELMENQSNSIWNYLTDL